MQHRRFFHILLVVFLCFSRADGFAYDFEVNGIYYTVVNRKKHQVEVTHWEEETTRNGQPHRHHHAPCSCCSHDACNEKDLKKALLLDSLAVIREKNAYIGEVCVPECVQYKHRKYSVIGVGDGAFYKRIQLTKVFLPESIRYIGTECFEGCKNLQEITLPTHLDRIGLGAFRHCAKLTSLTLPDDIQTINAYAFAFCVNLTTMRWPLHVTQMPGNVFWGCSKLRTIEMSHLLPPTISKEGLVMDFRNITFIVSPEALPAFRSDEVWKTNNLKVKE